MGPVHEPGPRSMDHGPGVHVLYFPVFLGVGKMGGPWAGSTEGVPGPGVHVLYFPQL